MLKNLDPPLWPPLAPTAEGLAIARAQCSVPRSARAAGPAQAQALRRELGHSLERLGDGGLRLHVAPTCEITPQGDGHFHLAPELFVQLSGSTTFRFPQGMRVLGPGEALVLPPKLLHAEQVQADGPQRPFRNVVIYAEGGTLSCHLAHEAAPGLPGILHLESCRHAQATRVHDWLTEASRLGRELDDAPPTDRRWAALQARSLVAAATAGVLRALDDADPGEPAEPPLVARLRVLVQNQLGDHALSVRSLARQSGCTPDYLSHVFSRTTGEHLAAHITRLRMERAARLLHESDMAGKEVAWACGYSSQSYFVRSFREHHGVTPTAWRRSAVAA